LWTKAPKAPAIWQGLFYLPVFVVFVPRKCPQQVLKIFPTKFAIQAMYWCGSNQITLTKENEK